MANVIKIKKGLNIPLKGEASDKITVAPSAGIYAICPDDFPGIIWKTGVKPGDKVEAGSSLLFSKQHPEICLVSPVKGIVDEVNRGERRHINYISVVAEEAPFESNLGFIPGKDSPEEIKQALMRCGLWAFMRQRPFDIVPSPDDTPRDIFITAFDSAPLAGPVLDNSLEPWLAKGIEALAKLTPGKVYLGISPGQKIDCPQCVVNEFHGPHPAGNVGPQIAAVKPVNKGETVWTLDVATAARIGRLVTTGELDVHTLVAVTGPMIKEPHFIKTIIGAQISKLVENNLKTESGIRIISGNVLTGIKVTVNDFLHFPYRQITVIEEGDSADEFMGWASVSPKKYSVKRSFPAFLRGLSKPFDFDARIKGGKRAMIMSGEYDKVFPFDIYPEYLIKAILSGDIDRMEKLGIYEVAPEDFALPEFVDTSKTELQKTVREGLDNLRRELS